MVPGETPANADYPWDEFDPVSYLAHNYSELREDDRQILTFVRDFLASASTSLADRPQMRGIDIGTGPNLYPALAMLPFCAEITLYEFSKSNVDWLEQQHAAGWPTWAGMWQQFWAVLCEDPTYARFDRPHMNAVLSRSTLVVHGSVFDLICSPDEQYDIGTMFFGPESLSPRRSEFSAALDHLLDALTPNAPFAVAFMEHSAGYDVGETFFPATNISVDDVNDYLKTRTRDVRIERVGTGKEPLRSGYSGMIVACGRTPRRAGS